MRCALSMLGAEMLKEMTGREVARRVSDGQVIGVGSGSTVMAAIAAISKRVATEGLRLSAVASSYETEDACLAAGIQVVPGAGALIDWAFDGADEVDPDLNLLKGRGGALLREHILAALATRLVILVDESKMVSRLGTRFPVAVEVVPAARGLVARVLRELGADEVTVRPAGSGKDGPVITEFGNLIFDVRFPTIGAGLAARIKAVSGVVETGIFEGLCDEVLVARQDGVWQGLREEGPPVTWRRLVPVDQPQAPG